MVAARPEKMLAEFQQLTGQDWSPGA